MLFFVDIESLDGTVDSNLNSFAVSTLLKKDSATYSLTTTDIFFHAFFNAQVIL